MKKTIPVSEARLKACCEEKSITIAQLGKKAGRSNSYFKNKLKNDNFYLTDITFLESIGISYDSIRLGVAERERKLYISSKKKIWKMCYQIS